MRRLALPLGLILASAGAAQAATAITVSITVTVVAIDVQWDAACRVGADTATQLNWPLGNQPASININGETSATYPRSCIVQSLGADIRVSLKTAASTGGVAWNPGAAIGAADVFRIDAKNRAATDGMTYTLSDFTAWNDLTTTDQILDNLVVGGGAERAGFWLTFYTPASSSDAVAKTIVVTATATTPP